MMITTTRRFPVRPTKKVLKYIARVMLVCKALVVVLLVDVSFIADVQTAFGESQSSKSLLQTDRFIRNGATVGTKSDIPAAISLESKDVGPVHVFCQSYCQTESNGNDR